MEEDVDFEDNDDDNTPHEQWPCVDLLSQYQANRTSQSHRQLLFLDSMELSTAVLKQWRTDIQQFPESQGPRELCLEQVQFKHNVELHHVTRFLTVCQELQAILLLGDREARYPYPHDSLEPYSLLLQTLNPRRPFVSPCPPLSPTKCQIQSLCLSRLRLQGQVMGQLLIGAISTHLKELHISSCYMDLAFAQGVATASANTTDITATATTSTVSSLGVTTELAPPQQQGPQSKHATSTAKDETHTDNDNNSNRPRANTNTSSSCGTLVPSGWTVAPLHTLEISSCNVTDAMMLTFAQDNEWDENCLQVLSLKFNALTAASLSHVAHLVRQHTASLQQLCLAGNADLFVLESSCTEEVVSQEEQQQRQDIDEQEHLLSDMGSSSSRIGWRSFLQALESLTRLESLDVSHCPMTVSMAAELVLSLPPSCKELNLVYTHLFQSTSHHHNRDEPSTRILPPPSADQINLPPGARQFFAALHHQTHVQVLNLEGCNITNDSVGPLFQALETTRVERLQLSGNEFTTVTPWAGSLPRLETLRELQVPPTVGSADTWSMWNDSLLETRSLTELRGTVFGRNPEWSEAMEAILERNRSSRSNRRAFSWRPHSPKRSSTKTNTKAARTSAASRIGSSSVSTASSISSTSTRLKQWLLACCFRNNLHHAN